MTATGRWVPLPEGQELVVGERARVTLEGEVRPAVVRSNSYCHLDNLSIGPTAHVVSVEVWEPAENLIVGSWYRDARGTVGIWSPNLSTEVVKEPWVVYGHRERDDFMVRPLAVAEWRALS